MESYAPHSLPWHTCMPQAALCSEYFQKLKSFANVVSFALPEYWGAHQEGPTRISDAAVLEALQALYTRIPVLEALQALAHQIVLGDIDVACMCQLMSRFWVDKGGRKHRKWKSCFFAQSSLK